MQFLETIGLHKTIPSNTRKREGLGRSAKYLLNVAKSAEYTSKLLHLTQLPSLLQKL